MDYKAKVMMGTWNEVEIVELVKDYIEKSLQK